MNDVCRMTNVEGSPNDQCRMTTGQTTRFVIRALSFFRHSSWVIRHLAAALLVFFASTAPSARAQTSYPMLMGLKPLAVQVGATTECEVSARYNLFGAYQVF